MTLFRIVLILAAFLLSGAPVCEVNSRENWQRSPGVSKWNRGQRPFRPTQDQSWYRPNISHNAWVKPGETRIFDALLVRHRYKPANLPGYLDLFPKMQGIPHAQMLAWFGLDTTGLSEVIMSLEAQDYAQTILIDNIRANRRASPTVLDNSPDEFFPFIDSYGQYVHGEWPGKIKSDADLIDARMAEDEDLADHPRPAEYNVYGGWKSGPTLEATGHFRTEKVEGKWWFVDPAGKLFWPLGSTGVGLEPMKVDLSGKEHFYEWLPDHHLAAGMKCFQPWVRLITRELKRCCSTFTSTSPTPTTASAGRPSRRWPLTSFTWAAASTTTRCARRWRLPRPVTAMWSAIAKPDSGGPLLLSKTTKPPPKVSPVSQVSQVSPISPVTPVSPVSSSRRFL